MSWISGLKLFYRKRKYRVGRHITQCIACDVNREIIVVSTDRIEDGLVTVREKTDNVLYLMKGVAESSEFSEPVEVCIDELWSWTGKPWGGLPDGTSIADHFPDDNPE